MQKRMKEHPLPEEEITSLLGSEAVGRLATLGVDGYPYVIPVHYAFLDGHIYIHGLAAGEKLENINKNPLVGFEVDSMGSLIHGDGPCNTNTEFKSVIIRGKAALVEERDEKAAALDAIVAKYAAQHSGSPYPDSMMKMTAVIRITVDSCTGKQYPG